MHSFHDKSPFRHQIIRNIVDRFQTFSMNHIYIIRIHQMSQIRIADKENV